MHGSDLMKRNILRVNVSLEGVC